MKPEISIIVPVYNVEPYLNRCLDSIINQSMKEIEILVINDGSTDKSGEICDEYAKLDDRIKVIHQKNGGLSNARNAGLEQAQGKYIMFVDSDDYVEKDFCIIPFKAAEKNCADLVMFRYSHIIDGATFTFPSNYKNLSIKNGKKSIQEAFDIMFKITSVGVWNKLYKKCLFKSIRFPEGMIYEDIGTSYKLLLESNSIYFINSVLYYYQLRNDSLSKNPNSKSKKDLIVLYYEMQEELNSRNLNFKEDVGAILSSLKYLIFYGRNSELSYMCNTIINDYLSKSKKRNNINEIKLCLLWLSQKAPLIFDFVSFFCKAIYRSKPF